MLIFECLEIENMVIEKKNSFMCCELKEVIKLVIRGDILTSKSF